MHRAHLSLVALATVAVIGLGGPSLAQANDADRTPAPTQEVPRPTTSPEVPRPSTSPDQPVSEDCLAVSPATPAPASSSGPRGSVRLVSCDDWGGPVAEGTVRLQRDCGIPRPGVPARRADVRAPSGEEDTLRPMRAAKASADCEVQAVPAR